MMKNIRALLLSSVAILGPACFTSCQLEPMELPAEELYVRAFINKFGLIDPNQTWSSAKGTEVTIVPDSHIANARVYGIRDGRTYIVARITDIDNKVTIPIDVPANVTDLKVDLDGDIFYTKVGGTVDPRNPASRQGINEGYNNNISISAGSTAEFPVGQIYELFTLLPERGKYDGNYPGNLEESRIHTDFLLNSGSVEKEIEVFPVFWNTCQTHELGIYYFTTSDQSQESGATVVRVPFYKIRKAPEFEDLNYYLSGGNKFNTYAVPAVDNGQYKQTVSVTEMSWDQYEAAKTNTASHHNILSHSRSDIGDWWAATHEVAINGRIYKVNDQVSYPELETDPEKQMKAAGLRWHSGNRWGVIVTDEKKGDGNSWTNQFRIVPPRPLIPGETVQLKAKVAAETAVNGVGIQLESFKGGYIGGAGSVNFPAIADGWGTVDITFTVPAYTKNGDLCDRIEFCLGRNVGTTENPSYNNTYYFDEVELIASPYDPQWDMPWGLDRIGKSYRPLRTGGTYDYFSNYYITEGNKPTYTSGGTTYDYMTKTSTTSAIPEYESAHLLIKNPSGQLCYPLADVPNRRNAAFLNDAGYKVVSKGIKIKIPANTRYGFYLHFYDMMERNTEKYIYSEVKGNIEFLTKTGTYGENNASTKTQWATYNADNADDRLKATYAAIFDQIYNDESYTYLTFEDWTPGVPSQGNGPTSSPVGDYDLNDLAFLVKNVNINTEIDNTPETFEYLICCEDLGVTDDFDFNDMIVGVSIVTEGSAAENNLKKYVTFRAYAAGGTLPLYLHCTNVNGRDVVVCPEGVSDPEWHNWFGVSDYTQMLNTQNSRSFLPGKSATVEVSTDFSLEGFGRPSASGSGNKGINGIYITVNSQNPASGDSYDPTANETITPPQPGEAPQMFLINDTGYDDGTSTRNWRWPSERKHIYEVFPGFSSWVTNAGSNADWYKAQPATGVYTNRPR